MGAQREEGRQPREREKSDRLYQDKEAKRQSAERRKEHSDRQTREES